MKYKDHDKENAKNALEERIKECAYSYPLPEEPLKVAVAGMAKNTQDKSG